jgi:hypothetical protein
MDVVLNYIDNATCDICLFDIKDDIVGVTCCNSLFHGKCIETNMQYSNICPRCEEMFHINAKNPLLTRLLRSGGSRTISPDDVAKIYAAIYQSNPEDLKIIDQTLRSQESKISYHEKFRGYFPYHIFDHNFDIDRFQNNWEIFCYGLLTGFNWGHTSACGRAVWQLAKNPIGSAGADGEHIYLVIHSRDYRKVRKQLGHLLDVIETNCIDAGFLKSDLTVYIQDGILVVNIRGIVRKICICVEYNDDPYWIIYSPKDYFNAYGSLFNGEMVNMTVKAIVNNKAPDFVILPTLEYVMGYRESDNNFSRRIGCGIGRPALLLRDVYPNYKLRISEKCGIDNIKRMMIDRIADDLNHILDVENCTSGPDATSDITMELVSESGSVDISTTIISSKHIRKQVSKIVYLQPLQLRLRKPAV